MPTLADLHARLDELSGLDRDRFRRRIGGASKIDDRVRQAKVLSALDRAITEAVLRYRLRKANAPETLTYPADLPITRHRDELLAVIRDNQVVIVAGETGSGKSTQLPKMCLELGRGVEGLIGHTWRPEPLLNGSPTSWERRWVGRLDTQCVSRIRWGTALCSN